MKQEALSNTQDSLQKQKIEGFTDYSNKLNALNSKQFAKFLITCEEVRPKSNDLKNFVKNEVKPFFALKQIIEFFSTEGDFVLDVFSGTGETLKMLSDLNRVATGVEKDLDKVSAYKKAVSEDSFLEDFPIIQKDAFDAVQHIDSVYDFILVDPPVKSHKMQSGADSIGDLPLENYIDYTASLIDSLSKNLKKDRFLVCLLQDFYMKGTYSMIPAMVSSKVHNLKLKGIKIYSRCLDINNIPNKRVYAPVQNHFYALIFTL